ncbi:hypothetical protein EV360DRAFT_80182 [Lentinula raphanica]|nr:hypothetical protein EV360DRAFT_80182 [Lentinula raphanica]
MFSLWRQAKNTCQPNYFVNGPKSRHEDQVYVVLGGKNPGIYSSKKVAYAQALAEKLPDPLGYNDHNEAMESWRAFCLNTHQHTTPDTASISPLVSSAPSISPDQSLPPKSSVDIKPITKDDVNIFLNERDTLIKPQSVSPNKSIRSSRSVSPSKTLRFLLPDQSLSKPSTKKDPFLKINIEAFMTDREISIMRSQSNKPIRSSRSVSPSKTRGFPLADPPLSRDSISHSTSDKSDESDKSDAVHKVEQIPGSFPVSYDASHPISTPSATSSTSSKSIQSRCYVVHQKGSYTVFSEMQPATIAYENLVQQGVSAELTVAKSLEVAIAFGEGTM